MDKKGPSYATIWTNPITHTHTHTHTRAQGPIYASTAGKLGGSIYATTWTNPCGCADGSCASETVTWTPTVTKQYTILATADSIGGVCVCVCKCV